MATTTQTEIIRYTVGVLGAAPGGFMTELEAIVAAGTSTSDLALFMADLMDDLNPTVAAYQSTATTTEFATAYMNNLLGSSVDATTLQLCIDVAVDLIDNGGLTRGQLVVAAVDFLNSFADDDTTWGNAKSQLDNRVSAATYYTITGAAAASTDVAALQSHVAAVTYDDTTVTTANAAVDAAIDQLPTPDQTFTLTSSATSVTEGNTVTFTITADHALSSADDPVTLTYNVAGDTLSGVATAATASTDFSPASGTVTFSAGDTSQTVTVTIPNDNTAEGIEGFKFTLLDSNFTSLGSKTVSITDDPNSGMTMTLTTGADTGSAFQGGAGPDTFIGVIGTDMLASAGTTFNPGDNLVGGAGNDTLSLSISGTSTLGATNTTSSVTLSGIERIIAANNETTADVNAIDLANATGVTTVGLSSSSATGDISFTNVQNIVDAEMKSGTGDLTISYASTLVTGTTDSQNLALANQTGGTFTANSIESLAITSGTAANTVTVAGDALTSISVTGDKGLALGTLAATVTTVNASGLTAGAFTVTGNTAVDYSITGGAGNDTVTISTGYTSADTLNGGSGTDTLSIAAAVTAASDLANVSNFEVLTITGANNVTLAAAAGGISTFNTADTNAQVITLNSGYTGDTTVVMTGNTAGGGADKVANSANVALTVKANAADLDADISIVGGTGTDTIILTADNDATGSVTTNISGVETITVAAGTTATNDIVITMGTNDTQISAGKTLTVDASALTNSGATLKFVGKTNETDGYLNVTGGAGNDSITGGASGRDTLTGGAGNDSLTLTTITANNVVAGGDGTDTLTVTTDMSSAAVLAGVTGVETLVLGASTDLTMATSIAATGITSISTADTSANVVTLSSGYTGDTTINMTGNGAGGGADKVVNSANVALTVKANAADLDADITITGGTGTDTITLTADNDATGSVLTNISGVETINVAANSTTSTHDIVITMDAVDTQISTGKTLTVNATALTDSAATLKFVGQTNETDGYLSVTGGAGADSITGGASGFDTLIGGAGNDSLTIVTLASTNVITGGDGTDSLTVTTDIAAASSLAGVTGVETLTLGASTDLTMATSIAATGITTISTAHTSANVVTLSAGYSGDTTITMNGNGAGGGADKVVNSANVALTVNANAADLDADITITGGTGTDTITLTADDDGTGSVITNISGVETITVAAGTTATNDIVITMGTNDTQISAGKTLTVDASALTDSAATLKFVGQTDETDGSLSIVGGAGADSITGGAYLDTITGGSGADTITFGVGANKFIYDTFTDAATGDILNVADKGTETFTSTKVTLAGAATFTDYLDAAAAGNGSVNGIFTWFQYGTNTYVVANQTNADGFTAGSDMVIELTGLLDISGSTVGDHILTLSIA
ncbi:MAG: beta strand repeat-containing protein [Thermodesulfobacteriota bacterium]